jgi:hypothetical protein
MAHTVNDSILKEFSRNPNGQLCIHFTDPAYVRADVIIYDSKDNSLHAVLEGSSHFIGYADHDLIRNLHDEDEIILAAPHHYSGTIKLHSRVSVS